MKSVAIILAAGVGLRMRSNTPKQYMYIGRYPMLYYSLATFNGSRVNDIILVVNKGDEKKCQRELVKKYKLGKVKAVVAGGKERAESVYNGLMACEEDYDVAIIHDAARPMVTAGMIDGALSGASIYKAIEYAVPAKDTIKRADSDELVIECLDRSELWLMQTPQAFDYRLCKDSYTRLIEGGEDIATYTDDAMVVEKLGGVATKLLMGDYKNIKVTTPEDAAVARLYLDDTQNLLK